MEILHEQVVAEPLEGCTPLSGCDLPSCGRNLAISTRPLEARIHHWPNHHFRNGTETMALMCDVEAQRQAVVYNGPSPEVPVAAAAILCSAAGMHPSSGGDRIPGPIRRRSKRLGPLKSTCHP
ncbi:MAG: hypothetical protein VYC64_01870 [Candidatus Latescibacterota bacterium]|nr:hypothetical protein [Candidatus Latescibacterota bacterium]